MRSLVRTFTALALAALVTLVPAAAASAKKPKAAAWAKKHDLSGTWRAKDADRDGVKNLAEYKLGTDPRKADTDKDGLKDGDEVKSGNDPLDLDTDGDRTKDGAEHAGVVTAFDGKTITIRQFKGAKLTATLDDCGTVADGAADDDDDFSDDTFVDSTEDVDWAVDNSGDDSASEEDEVDRGSDDACDFADLEVGAVLTSAELDNRDGVSYLVAVEIV